MIKTTDLAQINTDLRRIVRSYPSKAEAARALNLSRQTLKTYYFNGLRPSCTIHAYNRICSAIERHKHLHGTP